ncbi:MAG TPA: flagellar basal body rod protein [Oribacterium sp.]|nr:flagellar basal body rod protein [Oribacterium sp.]
MNMSFWTGAVGANQFTNKLSVSSNNLANINTNGYKAKGAPFQELINYNLNDSKDAKTELQAGAGSRVQQTNTNFDVSAFQSTGVLTDYALGDNNTFFKIKDPVTGAISYTRNGHFHSGEMADGSFKLVTETGKYVLDQNDEPLAASVFDIEALNKEIERIASGEEKEEEDTEETEETEEKPRIGVYTLPHPSRLLSMGDNEFAVQDGDTQNVPTAVPNPIVVNGTLEASSTDMAKEMTRVIESQRAFSYVLKMVQTSDEIEGTINGLRS